MRITKVSSGKSKTDMMMIHFLLKRISQYALISIGLLSHFPDDAKKNTL